MQTMCVTRGFLFLLQSTAHLAQGTCFVKMQWDVMKSGMLHVLEDILAAPPSELEDGGCGSLGSLASTLPMCSPPSPKGFSGSSLP